LLLLAAFQNCIKKLKDELLLFSRQKFDLLELALKLSSGSGFAFRRDGFASQKLGNRNFQRGCRLAILEKCLPKG
jgi:hypothetical protein